MVGIKEQLLKEQSLDEQLTEIREQIVDALIKSGGGHFGGSLSVVDILWILYMKILRIDKDNYHLRDRFILSKGHACIAQYVILAKLGYFDSSELANYGKYNSILEGHPNMLKTPGIDFSSGSLGQGLSIALGMSLGIKSFNADAWVVMGDGECQEGQVWEAALLASRQKIGNLKAIVDNNGYQEYGWFYDKNLCKIPVERIDEKFQSFGWKVLTVDGHDYQALEETFKEAQSFTKGPCVVIANTVKGKGYQLMEDDPIRFHCGELSESEYKKISKK